jgi:hypothetical protein
MNGNEESPLVEKKTEPASSREKSEPRHSKADSPGRPVRRPSMSMHAVIKHRGHRQRRSIATSRAPVPTRHLSPAGVTRRAPPRRSGKARTRAGGFFRRATACALTYSPSARRGEAQAPAFSSPTSPHGTPLYVASACVGDAIMAPPLLSPRRIGEAPRRARASPRSATDDEHSALLLSLPRPIRLIQRAPCIESCMEMEAQGFTSNPTDLCLCPSQSACLSVRSVHPFPSTGDRSIIGRGLHGRSPSQ